MQQCFCVLSQSHTRRRQALVAARLGPEVAVRHGALYLFGTRAWLTHCCSSWPDHGVRHAVCARYMYEHRIDLEPPPIQTITNMVTSPMLRSNIGTPCVILRGVLVEVFKRVSGIKEQPLRNGSRPRACWMVE